MATNKEDNQTFTKFMDIMGGFGLYKIDPIYTNPDMIVMTRTRYEQKKGYTLLSKSGTPKREIAVLERGMKLSEKAYAQTAVRFVMSSLLRNGKFGLRDIALDPTADTKAINAIPEKIDDIANLDDVKKVLSPLKTSAVYNERANECLAYNASILARNRVDTVENVATKAL